MSGRYPRRGTTPRPARRADGSRPNAYAAPCSLCGHEVAAGHGNLIARDGRWLVYHPAPRWYGSPVSGSYVGGCPDESRGGRTAS